MGRATFVSLPPAIAEEGPACLPPRFGSISSPCQQRLRLSKRRTTGRHQSIAQLETWRSNEWRMSTSARTIRFPSKLGLNLERRTRVEGEWTGRTTGLRDQRGDNCRDAITGGSPASSCRLPSRISGSDVASTAAGWRRRYPPDLLDPGKRSRIIVRYRHIELTARTMAFADRLAGAAELRRNRRPRPCSRPMQILRSRYHTSCAIPLP